MKIGIGNWARPFASVWRVIVFTLVVCATGQTWAAKPTPVVVWDGSSSFCNFSTLTQGDYTLNLNSQNTVSTDYSYVQIGSDNKKAGVTITSGVAGAFGTAGELTVIIVCDSLKHDQANRAIIGLTKEDGNYSDNFNTDIKFAIATGYSGFSTYLKDGIYAGYGTGLSYDGRHTMALTYSSETGGEGYFDGSRYAQYSTVAESGFTSPSGVVLGGLDVDNSTKIYAQTGMKIYAVAIFNTKLTAEEIAAYKFPNEYTATVSSDTSWDDIDWNGGADWSVANENTTAQLIVENNSVITLPSTLTAKSITVNGGTIKTTGDTSITAELSGSAALEVEGSSTLTLNRTINITGGTTVSSGAVLKFNASGTYAYSSLISGAGSVEVAAGTVTFSGSNSYTGNLTVKSGAVAKAGSNAAFGAGWDTSTTRRIIVENGGVADVNGQADMCYGYNIAGDGTGNGALINSGSEIGTGLKQTTFLELSADASVGGSNSFGLLASGWGATTLNLNDYILKKLGTNKFYLINTTINVGSQGKGRVNISSGTVRFGRKNWVNTDADFFTGSGTLELTDNGANTLFEKDSEYSGLVRVEKGSGYPVFSGSASFSNCSEFNAAGNFALNTQFLSATFKIRNLSGGGSVQPDWGSNTGTRTIETTQTKETTFSGNFNKNSDRLSGLMVNGTNSGAGVLNLSGDNKTTGKLTVQNNAKVVLTSAGKWAGPVQVEDSGRLQVESTTALGGTVTLKGGATVVLPKAVPLTATGVEIPSSGTLYVDLSAFGIADDASATIISATTLTGVENIGNLRSTKGLYTFAVGAGGNTIEATNLSSCIWDGSSWNRADPSLYSDVTVNVAAGGTTLTLDDDYSFDTITLSGSSGTLTIEANGHTLTVGDIVVPNGVTLVASSAFSVTGSISGGGNLTVPNGKTFTADCVISCSGNMTINGTLNLNTSPTCIVAGGNGTINLGSLSVANDISGFAANAAWSGSVVVPAFTSSGTTIIECNNLGSQNSKIVFKGITRNSWDYIYVNPAGYTINPTIQLDGNVELTSGVAPPYVTSFAKVTGEGNFALGRVWVGAKINYKINTLENYTGTLSAQRCEDSGTLAEMSLSVGTLALAGGSSPSTSDRLVKISSVSTLSNIVDVDAISVTIGGEATEYKLVKKNVGTATAGLYLAPAVIKNGSTLTPYESVSAAISAIGPYTTYDYVIINESAAISQNTMTLKLKKGFESVVLTVTTEYSEYTPEPSESSGVITYTLTPTQTTYTWASTLASGVWNTINPFPWRYGASVEANRAPSTCDDIQFATDATITVNEDISVYSIANSANVVFSTTATPTVAANAEGGIVLTAAGASFTVPVGMTLSPTPTTSVADYVVATTGGEESPTVYTAVLGAARVGGTAYATLQAAIDAAGENAVTLLQDNSESITIAAGRTLNVEKGGFTCNVPTSTGCIGVQSDYNDGTGITTYTAPVAAIISTSSTSYYMSISQAELMTFLTLLDADETATLKIDESVALDQATRTSLAIQYDIYFDGTTTYSKAVAKRTYPTVATFNSLASAISDSTDGARITLVRDSDEAITLNKSITLTESATFSGSFTGSGTIVLDAALKAPSADRWAAGWTGTVVLPAGALSSPLNFNLYGNSESVVQITGAVSGYLPNEEIVTTVKIPSSASLTLTAFSPSRTNTFAKIEGEGTLSVPVAATTGASGNDLGNAANWGSGYNYSAYLLIKDVSGFTGSLTANQAAGIAIGTKPHKNTVGGKIIVDSGASATIASGKTWSAVNGIVVDGTLDVAGNVTNSIAGGSGNGAKTLNVNSGATITMGSGKTISGLSAVNLKGGSVNLGKLTAATTQRYVAFSGESTLTLECEYSSGSGVIFNGDTIANPFIKVEPGATLNLSYGNFSGWNGDVCDGYIVNEGTLNISQKGSVSTFFRNHLIMTDGCTTTIGGTGKLSLYGGVATESTAQIQLASGAAEISSASAGIGFGNVSNTGGYGGKGVGITVGDDATLTISARIYASNVNPGSNPIAKYGEGTLILSNSGNSAAETWTLYAGAIKSVVELTVNSGDNSKQVRKIVNDGSYIYILSPAEVTTTTFDFNSFTYGGLPVTLGEDDTIIVPSNCTGAQWNPALSNVAGHPVIVRKDMNWKAGIGTMTIDTGVTVYAYGANGTSINDGSVISGSGTLALQDGVPVNGVASVLCTISGEGSFSLASRNATLTVSSPLADGKVTTSVTGAKVISSTTDGVTTYKVVYGTIFSVW